MPQGQLTKCELELMDIVWRRGRVTVQEVSDQLTRPLAYTTVMSTMNTLEDKEVIRRCGKSGRAFIYESILPRKDVQQAMTESLTESLFGGSVKTLMMSLLGSQKMTSAEIIELKSAIQNLESENSESDQ